jgi:hypothetical protein
MKDEEKEDRRPDHEKDPPEREDRPADHGRPVPRHGSAAMGSASPTKAR